MGERETGKEGFSLVTQSSEDFFIGSQFPVVDGYFTSGEDRGHWFFGDGFAMHARCGAGIALCAHDDGGGGGGLLFGGTDIGVWGLLCICMD